MAPLPFLRSKPSQIVLVSATWTGALLLFQDMPNGLRWPGRVLLLIATLWLLKTLFGWLRTVQITGKKLAFCAVIGVFYYVGVLIACQVFVTIMSKRDDRLTFRGITKLSDESRKGINALINNDRLNLFDKDIGWALRPSYINKEYIINKQGVRSRTEYPLPAPDVGKRILCIGDSYTFGSEVKEDESYPAQAEQLLAGTEWINLGTPGTCLVQSYQRYLRDAPKFGGKHVVVGFMSNDAQRTVNCFRPFVNEDSGCPYTKPFAKFADGKFSIEPNPYSSFDDFRKLLADDTTEMRKLLKLDYIGWCGQNPPANPVMRTALYVWESRGVDQNLSLIFNNSDFVTRFIERHLPVDPYGRVLWRTETPGFKAITGMFDRYHQQIVSDGRVPLFVILPGPGDIKDLAAGHPCLYTSLIEHLTAHHIPHLDFLPVLAAKHQGHLNTASLFVQVHYKPQINKELAAEIIQKLQLQ